MPEREWRWWQREWNPNPGASVGRLVVLAMGAPVAGVLFIIDGQVWLGILALLCAVALTFTAWVFLTRARGGSA